MINRYPTVRDFAIIPVVFILTACGGGGGGGGDSDTTQSPPQSLNAQNSNATTYFSKAEQWVLTSISVDEDLEQVDPTDPDAVTAILNRDDANVALSQEIENLGNAIFAAEQNLQGVAQKGVDLSGVLTGSYSDTRAGPAAVVLGVCSLGLTAVSWGLSMNDSIKKNAAERKSCNDKYRQDIASLPEGLTSSELALLHRLSYEEMLACHNLAKENFRVSYFDNTFGAFASVFGPKVLPQGKGNITFQGIMSLGDVNNIYVIGTQADESGNRSTRSDETGLAFIASADPNGTIEAPEGDWNLIAFAPGAARFGTTPDQFISVDTGQTTVLDVSSVITDNATAGDLQTCSSGGNDQSDIEGLEILAIKNLAGDIINGPSGSQIANADIQLSGNAARPTIAWNFDDAVIVDLLSSGLSGSAFSWGISGVFIEEIPDTGIGRLAEILSPVQYGDYSVPQTEPIEDFDNPSPDLTSGALNLYTVTVRTETEAAFITFRIN